MVYQGRLQAKPKMQEKLLRLKSHLCNNMEFQSSLAAGLCIINIPWDKETGKFSI
jgi:hypothetical protein